MKHLTDHKTRVTAENNTKESSLPLKRQILKTAITVLNPGSIVLRSFTCSRNLLYFTDLLKFTTVLRKFHNWPKTLVRLIVYLLMPTGHVTHQQFNIQQLYVLPTLYLCVLYLSEKKQRLVPLTA